MCGRGHLQCRTIYSTYLDRLSLSSPVLTSSYIAALFSAPRRHRAFSMDKDSCFLCGPRVLLAKLRDKSIGVADPVRAYRLVMLTGPATAARDPRRVPTPLSPPAYAYSDSPLADDSDLEPDPGLTWIDSDEESDTNTELMSPASDADLELDDFPYAWLMDRACFAALDAQPLINPVQCFAEVCWADAVHALVAARHWADIEELDPPLADEPHTPPPTGRRKDLPMSFCLRLAVAREAFAVCLCAALPPGDAHQPRQRGLGAQWVLVGCSPPQRARAAPRTAPTRYASVAATGAVADPDFSGLPFRFGALGPFCARAMLLDTAVFCAWLMIYRFVLPWFRRSSAPRKDLQSRQPVDFNVMYMMSAHIHIICFVDVH
ncbi:hypothetical protein B0H14DRAFT_3899245 [Mycena olivaceomarginata]|nr:hypothetical protein B0H14DRAFT_3899245 [Mycena olivaceomarginata]